MTIAFKHAVTASHVCERLLDAATHRAATNGLKRAFKALALEQLEKARALTPTTILFLLKCARKRNQ